MARGWHTSLIIALIGGALLLAGGPAEAYTGERSGDWSAASAGPPTGASEPSCAAETRAALEAAVACLIETDRQVPDTDPEVSGAGTADPDPELDGHAGTAWRLARLIGLSEVEATAIGIGFLAGLAAADLATTGGLGSMSLLVKGGVGSLAAMALEGAKRSAELTEREAYGIGVGVLTGLALADLLGTGGLGSIAVVSLGGLVGNWLMRPPATAH